MFLTISKRASGSETGKCGLGAGRAGRAGSRARRGAALSPGRATHPCVPEQLPSASPREDRVPLTPKQSAAHPGDTGDAVLLPGESTRRLLGCTAAGHGTSRAGRGHPIPRGSPGGAGSRLGAGGVAVRVAGGAVGALMVAPVLRAPRGSISGSGLQVGEARREPRGHRDGTPSPEPPALGASASPVRCTPAQAASTARCGHIWQHH